MSQVEESRDVRKAVQESWRTPQTLRVKRKSQVMLSIHILTVEIAFVCHSVNTQRREEERVANVKNG